MRRTVSQFHEVMGFAGERCGGRRFGTFVKIASQVGRLVSGHPSRIPMLCSFPYAGTRASRSCTATDLVPSSGQPAESSKFQTFAALTVGAFPCSFS